jgi:hypothetical protein
VACQPQLTRTLATVGEVVAPSLRWWTTLCFWPGVSEVGRVSLTFASWNHILTLPYFDKSTSATRSAAAGLTTERLRFASALRKLTLP